MRNTVRFAALVLVAALPHAVISNAAAGPPSRAASASAGGFTGICTITGTVIPFTDFDGAGNCTGMLDGQFVAGTPVTAVATAVGTSIGPLPLNQTGEGSIVFTATATRIDFTFTQVLTNLVLTGTGGGSGLGEVVPLELQGETRTAQVVATAVGLRSSPRGRGAASRSSRSGAGGPWVTGTSRWLYRQ